MLKLITKRPANIITLQTQAFASPSGMGTLKKSQVPRQPHLSRVDWMHNQSKTPNTEAYDWKPELLTRIDPAPNYKNSPLAKIKGKKYVNLKMGEETAFHYRSAVMKKMYHKEKKVLGRIFAHLK